MGEDVFCIALAWNWWKCPDWVWVGFSLGCWSGRIVSPFGTWFLGQDGKRGRVDGHGGWGCCSEGCGCGASTVFCLFWEWLFGGYDDVRVVIEIVVGAGVLVWWRWSVVWEYVWEFAVLEIEEGVQWVVEKKLVWLTVEELGGGIVQRALGGPPMSFSIHARYRWCVFVGWPVRKRWIRW